MAHRLEQALLPGKKDTPLIAIKSVESFNLTASLFLGRNNFFYCYSIVPGNVGWLELVDAGDGEEMFGVRFTKSQVALLSSPSGTRRRFGQGMFDPRRMERIGFEPRDW